VKSAYELAMERLEKKTPSVSLTDEQKQQDKQFHAASHEDTSSAMAIPVKNRR
jgi:hypothetical protein